MDDTTTSFISLILEKVLVWTRLKVGGISFLSVFLTHLAGLLYKYEPLLLCELAQSSRQYNELELEQGKCPQLLNNTTALQGRLLAFLPLQGRSAGECLWKIICSAFARFAGHHFPRDPSGSFSIQQPCGVGQAE